MERQLTHIIALFSLLCLALVTTGAAAAEPEKCQVDDLVFGMSSALEGPISGLGLSMRAGVKAAFSEANRQGGINGHNLCLISMNDGYEPEQTVSNIRQLIQQDKVLALIGNVGTPTAVVAAPICQQMKTLLYGAYTGAGVLRKTPPDRYVINYRASYAEETEAMVNGLIVYGGLQPHEIAFLTQRDAFGDTGFTGGIQALRRHGLKDESRILHVRYERNTDDVENALATLLLASPAPKAIILVAAYSPCSKFIRLARAYGIKSRLLTVSFVGADLLAKKLGSAGEGVIITQVVPHAQENLPITTAFRNATQGTERFESASFTTLEGYIAGRILIKALRTLKDKPSREQILEALENLGEFDIGTGFPLHLSKLEHQASHQVWPTVISNSRVIPFKWQDLAD